MAQESETTVSYHHLVHLKILIILIVTGPLALALCGPAITESYRSSER